MEHHPSKVHRANKNVGHNQYDGQVAVTRSLEKLTSGPSSRNMTGIGVANGAGHFALSSADVQHLQIKSSSSTQ